ncbi:MAG: phage tail family protein [Candidatus Omnitrophica bacterium]|nr:phage tail family protein [Candidatus Omnitrophota bacterium]
MANEIDINIGSFNLDETNQIAVADIDIKVAKAISQSSLAKSHGSVIPIGKRNNLTVKIKGTIIGTNYDNLRANLDNLKAALEKDSEQNLTLDDDRKVKVQYSGFSYSYRTLRTFADFSFDLIASDPLWYNQAISNDTRTPTSGSGYTVNNPGNAPTRCKVTLTNNSGGAVVDNIRLKNNTTGEEFQYRGTLANTKALVVNNRVDDEDVSVLNDGVDDIKNFEGDFITLNAGDNTIVYTGAANVEVKIEFYPAYF